MCIELVRFLCSCLLILFANVLYIYAPDSLFSFASFVSPIPFSFSFVFDLLPREWSVSSSLSLLFITSVTNKLVHIACFLVPCLILLLHFYFFCSLRLSCLLLLPHLLCFCPTRLKHYPQSLYINKIAEWLNYASKLCLLRWTNNSRQCCELMLQWPWRFKC